MQNFFHWKRRKLKWLSRLLKKCFAPFEGSFVEDVDTSEAKQTLDSFSFELSSEVLRFFRLLKRAREEKAPWDLMKRWKHWVNSNFVAIIVWILLWLLILRATVICKNCMLTCTRDPTTQSKKFFGVNFPKIKFSHNQFLNFLNAIARHVKRFAQDNTCYITKCLNYLLWDPSLFKLEEFFAPKFAIFWKIQRLLRWMSQRRFCLNVSLTYRSPLQPVA